MSDPGDADFRFLSHAVAKAYELLHDGQGDDWTERAIAWCTSYKHVAEGVRAALASEPMRTPGLPALIERMSGRKPTSVTVGGVEVLAAPHEHPWGEDEEGSCVLCSLDVVKDRIARHMRGMAALIDELRSSAEPWYFCPKCGYVGPDEEHGEWTGSKNVFRGPCPYTARPVPGADARTAPLINAARQFKWALENVRDTRSYEAALCDALDSFDASTDDERGREDR